jgi:hypothetical protein
VVNVELFFYEVHVFCGKEKNSCKNFYFVKKNSRTYVLEGQVCETVLKCEKIVNFVETFAG